MAITHSIFGLIKNCNAKSDAIIDDLKCCTVKVGMTGLRWRIYRLELRLQLKCQRKIEEWLELGQYWRCSKDIVAVLMI